MRPLGFPKELKNAVSIHIAPVEILTRNDNVTSEEHKTNKKLQGASWVAVQGVGGGGGGGKYGLS